MLGKKFGLIRVYDFWNGPPVKGQDIQRIVAEDRMVLVSHKANRDRRQGPLVKFAFCATGSALDSEEDLTDWHPGNDCVDLLAPDRYNWWTYEPGGSVDNPVWEPFPLLFEKILSVARFHKKPIVVGEWASHPSVNTTDKNRPAWLTEAAAYMRTHPEFVGYCYYHSKPDRTGNDWRLTEADKVGYDAFVNDDYFLSVPRSAAV